jgi:hypothetical protein
MQGMRTEDSSVSEEAEGSASTPGASRRTPEEDAAAMAASGMVDCWSDFEDSQRAAKNVAMEIAIESNVFIGSFCMIAPLGMTHSIHPNGCSAQGWRSPSAKKLEARSRFNSLKILGY